MYQCFWLHVMEIRDSFRTLQAPTYTMTARVMWKWSNAMKYCTDGNKTDNWRYCTIAEKNCIYKKILPGKAKVFHDNFCINRSIWFIITQILSWKVTYC